MMNTILALEHSSIARINDLNSVLLEGEIIETNPPVGSEEGAKVLVLKTSRYDKSDGRKDSTSYIRVDVQMLQKRRKVDFHVGSKIRVVGRLSVLRKRPALVIAEHVEQKPGYFGAA
jgi:hypothetical protein